MIYYTADLHFGCSNRYEDRTKEMDEQIIRNWNKRVGNGDKVYILGDLGKEGPQADNEYLIKCLSLLKGHKILIQGNHDHLKDLRIRQQFEEIHQYHEIQDSVKGKTCKLVLFHYPILFWNGQHQGKILLYGHLHATPEEQLFQKQLKAINKYFAEETAKGRTDCPKVRAYNVGCMNWDYRPRTLEEIFNETV